MVDTFLVSSPKKVFTSIIDLIKANNFWNHIFTTVYEIIISFILGNVIGLLVASILWFNKFLARVFEPFLTILNSLPKVALRTSYYNMGRSRNASNNSNGTCNIINSNNTRHTKWTNSYRQRKNKNGTNI